MSVLQKTQFSLSAIGLALLLAITLPGCKRASTGPTTTTPPRFGYTKIGPELFFRPTITNIQIVDFYEKGNSDLLVCDAQRNCVLLYERLKDNSWRETELGKHLLAPAHATLVDIDQDNDNDVIVSVMGNLHPDDGVIGSVVLLEQQNGEFKSRVVLDDVRRVVDVQPADFDQDGDIDLAVAVFGYLRGQVLWLENLGDGRFRDHELHNAPGTIHVPVADFDNDGDPDIAAIVSQEEEEVWIFENTKPKQFEKRKVFQSINYDLGSAGLVSTDLDQDGDVDLLLPVGDNLEDRFSHAQPYHGCLWLENRGNLEFQSQRICTFPGTYAAAVSDLDGDSDNDIALVSMVNEWDSEDGSSICWLENDGQQNFTKHHIANRPIQLVTVACGDINGDEKNDIVAGGLHVFRPYDRLGRISGWINQASDVERHPDANTGEPETRDGFAVPNPNLHIEDEITRASIESLETALSDAVAQDIDQAHDWKEMGRVYFAYGFFDSANVCFQKWIEKEKTSAEAWYYAGISLGRLGQSVDAKSALVESTKLAEGELSQRCWHELGRCYLRLNSADEAEAAFLEAGNHAWSLYERAKLMIRSDRTELAIPVLDQLANVQPNAVEYFLLRARAMETMGNHQEAARLRDMAEYNSRRMPANPFDKTIESIRESIGIEQLNQQAFDAYRNQQWDAAADLFARVVENAWNQQSFVLFAATELKRNNPKAAIELLSKLMNQCGQFPEAMVLLGDAHLANDNADEALRVWTELAKLRSGIALHQRLEKLYRQLGDEEKTNQQLGKKLQAQGIADLRNSKIALAQRSFEQAVTIAPDLATSWFYLGECHTLRGNKNLSEQAYSRCQKLAPEHGRSFAAMKRLSKHPANGN